MKRPNKFYFLFILAGFIFTSCNLYNYSIWFINDSSYKVSVNCDVTNPSSFTINPGDSLFVDSKIDDVFNLNIKYNDNYFVNIFIEDSNMHMHAAGNITFKNK